jgi:hypothetical protein
MNKNTWRQELEIRRLDSEYLKMSLKECRIK